MKAWKKGALIGGILGFPLGQSITGLVVGAVIGALFAEIINQFYKYFLPETEPPLWKKGAFIGALWGFFSFFIILGGAFGPEYGGPTPKSTLIIALPMTIIGEIMMQYSLNDNFILLVLMGFFGPVIFGALIGSIIFFAIEKFRMWRPSK